MRTVTTRGRKVVVPEHVGELTPVQYEYFCRLFFALSAEAITVDYLRIRWFSYLLGRGKSDFTVLKAGYVSELESQMSAIDGFFVDDFADGVRMDFSSVVNLLPEYGGYRGPGDLLQGVTFGDFVECCSVMDCLEAGDADSVRDPAGRGVRQP